MVTLSRKFGDLLVFIEGEYVGGTGDVGATEYFDWSDAYIFAEVSKQTSIVPLLESLPMVAMDGFDAWVQDLAFKREY
jgi:hypothetical protein